MRTKPPFGGREGRSHRGYAEGGKDGESVEKETKEGMGKHRIDKGNLLTAAKRKFLDTRGPLPQKCVNFIKCLPITKENERQGGTDRCSKSLNKTPIKQAMGRSRPTGRVLRVIPIFRQ